MPSTYAHYKFGNDVLKRLTGNEKHDIEACRSLYSIGLHGPDLLFFYKPLCSNPLNRIGFGMHDRPASEFFLRAGKILRSSNFSPEYAAYIYGFICHFALDRECHGYIDEKIASSGVSHVEIEAEFDRSLLLQDGFDPVSKILTDHIHPSRKAAGIIKDFFPGVTEKGIYKSLRSFIFYNGLLCAPRKSKRKLIYEILHLACHEEIRGMIINYHPNPLCEDSTEMLYTLYDKAVDKAVKLINGFSESASGKKPYDPLYQYTFSSKLL